MVSAPETQSVILESLRATFTLIGKWFLFSLFIFGWKSFIPFMMQLNKNLKDRSFGSQLCNVICELKIFMLSLLSLSGCYK